MVHPTLSPRSAPLSADEQQTIRDLIASRGIAAAAERLGVSRATLASAASGCRLYRTTRALLADRVRAVATEARR